MNAPTQPKRAALEIITDLAPQPSAERTLLVMLPGAGDHAREFIKYGFVQALRERNLAIDVMAVNAHTGYYLDSSLVDCLEQDVFLPARANGYRQIWLTGISLGGMGSLLYAKKHPDRVRGVILLAPYLGNRARVTAIAANGGLAVWPTDTLPSDDNEGALLAWLKQYQLEARSQPDVFLGYGVDDRFAEAFTLIEKMIPESNLIKTEGGHDWQTWANLWQHLLDVIPFPVIQNLSQPT